MKLKITYRPRYNPWLKNLSKILAFGILLNNIPINSFASVLSEDTRYETFIESNITVNDILEEDKINLKIEGNTLVNNCLNDTKNGVLIDGINRFDSSMIKPNTEYTLIFEIPENNLKDGSNFIIELHDYKELSRARIQPGETGKFIKKVTTFDTVSLTPWISSNTSDRGNVVLKNLMVLEGDWTNSEIPEYFEGIKSSFEDQLVTQEMVDTGKEKAENLGKYKVEVKSSGKNIFDTSKIIYMDKDGYSLSGETWATTIMNENDVKEILKPNTKYQYRMDVTCNSLSELPIYSNLVGFMFYKNLSECFQMRTSEDFEINETKTIQGEFITPNDLTGYRLLSYSKRFTDGSNIEYGDFTFSNIQIEEGSVATEYEPYKESINTFYLNSPLLEGDTIEVINGQAYHIHKSEISRLDGSKDEEYQNWITTGNTPPENTSVFILLDSKEKHLKNIYLYGYNTEKMLSNKFLQGQVSKGPFKMQFYINLHLSVPTNELISPDEVGFKEWLQNNPTTVIYKLANPIYEPIKANLSVNLFEGTTHISNNSNIPATMEVTVDRVLNRAVEFTELVKVTPTINNLSKARYWNNLLKDSIKKDQLQEEVNSITKLNDMVLDKKIASSNLDLYIKSENILMMSLSTNNITFEDFSGIEDMTKENAVQISINSSLPYQLNTYLPTEIQNSDKSNTMNKNILNIKENSESAYQTFSNTTDKIILKDNCSAGNDLIHGVDIKLKGGIAHEKDIYKTTIKFEAEQK